LFEKITEKGKNLLKENTKREIGKSDQDMYNDLVYYTLDHPDKIYFIHQHVVDAYTAQHADDKTKPISITFALAGLYLFIEKNYSGKQVQMAHIRMAKNKKAWPAIKLPVQRGVISISNVLETLPGKKRDLMIRSWCISVWQAFVESHASIESLVRAELGV
jgi:hypothetical protein